MIKTSHIGTSHLCRRLIFLGRIWKSHKELIVPCMCVHVLYTSQCVEALQPPLREEAVCLVGRVLVVTSSWCTEVWQHGLVVLPLRRFLPVLLIIIPVDNHTLAVHQGLGSAPAKSNKLRVTEHWVQVLQQPRFSFGVWKHKGKNICLSISLSTCTDIHLGLIRSCYQCTKMLILFKICKSISQT